MFSKIIITFFALYSTLILGQHKNSHSWDEAVADINNHKSHIESIIIAYAEDHEEHIDSLMIVNTENFEDISLELYSTVLEYDMEDNEKMYVIAQNYTIINWHTVEKTDYGITLILNEEAQTSKINTVQLTCSVDSKEIRHLIHDAFRYLTDANKVYQKKKRDANTCQN